MSFYSIENIVIPEDVQKAIISGINQPNLGIKADGDKIDKKYVHKYWDENVVISNVSAVDEEKKIFRVKLIIDTTHKFFFDHSLKHVPGILMLEASRQFATAVSHLYFGAPFNSQFILHSLGTTFTAEADAEYDVLMDGMIFDIVLRKRELRKMKGVAYIHQNNKVVGSVASAWSIVPADVLARLGNKFH